MKKSKKIIINHEKIYDLIIIGAGPAGISAAIYAKRAMLSVLMFEEDLIGGKLNKTGDIENYTGFKSIKGSSLSKMMEEQLLSFNFKIENKKIRSLKKEKDVFIAKTDNDETFFSKSTIISTGTIERKLEIEGEKELTNSGVSYCAVCDGFLFKDKDVLVIGGGYSGCESANYLSNIARKVYLVHHGKELKVDLRLKEIINSNKKIEIFLESEIIKIIGNKKVESSIILINKDIEKEINVSGVFPCIGLIPNSQLVEELEVCDSAKYILVNENCSTKINGLFSAGDVNKKRNRQIATAVSDGVIASQSAISYLNSL
ncbi:MAG: Thioredoxin reductase [Mycoplasmataceae bacterium]|nr:MAG: Thioredoxin reductase [Mycoplasmataceae bacterium]